MVTNLTKRSDYIFSLITRGVVPAASYFSLLVIARTLANDDLEKYLFTITLTLWIVAGCYQWQKNAIIRFVDPAQWNISGIVKAFLLSGIIGSIILTCIGIYSEKIYLAGISYVFFLGTNYIFGPMVRISGLTKQFHLLEIIYTCLKWCLGVVVAIMFASGEMIFYALSLGSLLLSLHYFKILSNRCGLSYQMLLQPNNNQGVRLGSLKAFGILMVISDFSGAGLIYVDRFFVASSDASRYIISSTIGNQIVSVIMGALVMVAYPRLSYLKKNNLLWFKEFRSFWKRYLQATGVSLCISVTFGYWLIYFIKPELQPRLFEVFLFSLSHSIYYLCVLFSLPFILENKLSILALTMFISFSIFGFASFFVQTYISDPSIFLLIKITTLSLAAFVLHSFMKKMQLHNEN